MNFEKKKRKKSILKGNCDFEEFENVDPKPRVSFASHVTMQMFRDMSNNESKILLDNTSEDSNVNCAKSQPKNNLFVVPLAEDKFTALKPFKQDENEIPTDMSLCSEETLANSVHSVDSDMSISTLQNQPDEGEMSMDLCDTDGLHQTFVLPQDKTNSLQDSELMDISADSNTTPVNISIADDSVEMDISEVHSQLHNASSDALQSESKLNTKPNELPFIDSPNQNEVESNSVLNNSDLSGYLNTNNASPDKFLCNVFSTVPPMNLDKTFNYVDQLTDDDNEVSMAHSSNDQIVDVDRSGYKEEEESFNCDLESEISTVSEANSLETIMLYFNQPLKFTEDVDHIMLHDFELLIQKEISNTLEEFKLELELEQLRLSEIHSRDVQEFLAKNERSLLDIEEAHEKFLADYVEIRPCKNVDRHLPSTKHPLTLQMEYLNRNLPQQFYERSADMVPVSDLNTPRMIKAIFSMDLYLQHIVRVILHFADEVVKTVTIRVIDTIPIPYPELQNVAFVLKQYLEENLQTSWIGKSMSMVHKSLIEAQKSFLEFSLDVIEVIELLVDVSIEYDQSSFMLLSLCFVSSEFRLWFDVDFSLPLDRIESCYYCQPLSYQLEDKFNNADSEKIYSLIDSVEPGPKLISRIAQHLKSNLNSVRN